MANNYEIEIEAQPYWGCTKPRTIKVYFSMPDDSIILERGKPGICFLAAGFGGDSNASVYKKMRQIYADRENWVVIQCDYMGTEYMNRTMNAVLDAQTDIIVNNLLSYVKEEQLLDPTITEIYLQDDEEISEGETIDNFCEMGIFQAIDCINAVFSVLKLLNSIEVGYNEALIIGYGHSHGAYLLYLMNAFFPNLFSTIIDNSAWLKPEYFEKVREVLRAITFSYCGIPNKIVVKKEQKLHALEWIDDTSIYDLRIVYDQIENKSKIICYHGESDSLVPVDFKKNFLNKMENTCINIVHEKDIDGVIFKNTEHGLGSDFLRMLDMVIDNETLIRDNTEDIYHGSILITDKYKYVTTVDNEIPKLERELI